MQFTDQERLIFPYHDGTQIRYGDPLAIRRALLQASRGELYSLAEKAAGPPEYADGTGPTDRPPRSGEEIAVQMEAQAILLDVIRTAFQLPPLDPMTAQGCTEAMAWKVWDSYMAFLEGENKPAGNSATSPAPTASLPAVPPVTVSSSR